MAMAIFGIGIMFGPIIGPLMGGWITDNWSWNWIFYINVPIGILSILMVMFFIVDPPYMERSKMKIDTWGLFFLVIGLGCLQIVLDKGQREDWFSSEFIAWMAFAAVAALIAAAILGLRRRGSCFAVAPCIPGSWDGFVMRWRHGGSLYEITVENPGHHSRGVAQALHQQLRHRGVRCVSHARRASSCPNGVARWRDERGEMPRCPRGRIYSPALLSLVAP